MIKTTTVIVLAAFLAVSATGMTSVSAQTTATMPTLYSQSGVAMNVSTNTYLPAGWYFLQPGGAAASQVYYYGNGTFYNANTMTYGGSIGDPNGTAGVVLNYTSPVGTPGLPNTGAGGNSAMVWMTLILSGMVAVAGLAFLANSRPRLVLKRQ
jgi:hypothetical protein